MPKRGTGTASAASAASGSEIRIRVSMCFLDLSALSLGKLSFQTDRHLQVCESLV